MTAQELAGMLAECRTRGTKRERQRATRILLEGMYACRSGRAYARRFDSIYRAWSECDRSELLKWWIRHAWIIRNPGEAFVSSPDCRALQTLDRVLDALWTRRTPKRQREECVAIRAIFTLAGMRS